MNRQLIVLAAVVAILVVVDSQLRSVAGRASVEASLLRPLVDPRAEIVPERVRTITIRYGDRAQPWTYELRGKSWRYPAYFDSYVLGDRIDQLLRSLLQSSGTRVSTNAADHGRFGVTSDSAVKISLSDGQGVGLLEVWVGRGAPGPRAGEAYVRSPADDAILLLHANPRHALSGGARVAPLLDPQVMPRSLARKPIVRLNFITVDDAVPGSLWRTIVEPDTNRLHVPRPGGPEYTWLAGTPGSGAGEDSCRTDNVFAYMSFVRRLRYEELHDPDPTADYGFAADNRIELIDEDGGVDVLEVGKQSDSGVFVRNQSAGIVCTISPEKAALLFPALQQTLIDSLARPSPYDLAESGGRP